MMNIVDQRSPIAIDKILPGPSVKTILGDAAMFILLGQFFRNSQQVFPCPVIRRIWNARFIEEIFVVKNTGKWGDVPRNCIKMIVDCKSVKDRREKFSLYKLLIPFGIRC